RGDVEARLLLALLADTGPAHAVRPHEAVRLRERRQREHRARGHRVDVAHQLAAFVGTPPQPAEPRAHRDGRRRDRPRLGGELRAGQGLAAARRLEGGRGQTLSGSRRRRDPLGSGSPSPIPSPVQLHLVDGTYELFRSFYGAPAATAPDGHEVGAVRGLLASLASLLREPGVTHVAIAFDTVIESFRNELFAGYKT